MEVSKENKKKKRKRIAEIKQELKTNKQIQTLFAQINGS